MTARLVVLVSGGGTNLQAIIDACASGALDAEVVAVVSDRQGAHGLVRAERSGIPGTHVPVDGRSRAIYDGVLAHVVGEYEPTLVVLAGWMRLLSNGFLRRFNVVNIHPALPGEFPGLHAIERSFAAWQAGVVEQGGVMVHWVPDDGVDDGPVIASQPVPILDDDTVNSFAERVHQVEHELFVTAIRSILPDLSSTKHPGAA